MLERVYWRILDIERRWPPGERKGHMNQKKSEEQFTGFFGKKGRPPSFPRTERRRGLGSRGSLFFLLGKKPFL